MTLPPWELVEATLLKVVLPGFLGAAIVLTLVRWRANKKRVSIFGPAVAARQWTDRLGVMLGLAALFGALSGVAGAVLSVTQSRLPTGPMIILCATVIVVVSILFAPHRGLLWDAIRQRRHRRRLRRAALTHTDLEHAKP